MNVLIEKAELEHKLTREEIVSLLGDSSIDEELFAAADRVRKQYVGDEVHLRGLIEFSNYCQQNCLYCGLRRENTQVTRYRLTPDEIVDFAQKAAAYGYKTIVLQSGEDPYYTVERMKEIIRRIKELGVAVTLSIGEKTMEEYEEYRKAGADRYLLRIETTDRALYQDLDPGMSWENRVQCLKILKEQGWEVGTGSMVGLPGQTLETIAEDILFFQSIDADMIGIGPFIPNPQTPLAAEKGDNFPLSRKVLAIIRLLLPDSNIPATTAMEALNPEGRILALKSGANVVMPNVTEGEYRGLYVLYPGKICINDTPGHCRSCITGKIQSIGRSVSSGHGFRQRSEKKTI
ncbi:MAG: [FeFe] hydrogenase maturase subunit HydE [Firmicutes bacterium]|nr:[FeFe] hydrogenase maturase subunit HydE [Bacillota bacterium]